MPNEPGAELPRVPAGLLRRLGAILYDSLLVVGVLAVATLFVVPFMGVLIPAEIGSWAYLYRALLLLLVVLFFGYFWTRRGQTIGMLAWRLRITRNDERPIGWQDCANRLATLGALLLPVFVGDWLFFSRWDRNSRSIALYASLVPLAASYAWICIDQQRRAWHDRLSSTRVWLLPKRASR